MLSIQRVLFDTNIFIYREDNKLPEASVLQLISILNELDIKIIKHPKSLEDIERDDDIERRRVLLAKLAVYDSLELQADPVSDPVFSSIIDPPTTHADEVDNALLYAVYAKSVPFLITNDGGIHKKAQKLDVKAEVLSIAEAIHYFKILQAAKGKPQSWQVAWDEHTRAKVFGAITKLIGRDEQLKELRALLDDESVRIALISGPSQIGKTRFVLEATKTLKNQTIVISDPQSMELKDLVLLAKSKEDTGETAWVVIDDPAIAQAEEIIMCPDLTNLKKIRFILAIAEYHTLLSLGQKDVVKGMILTPLSDPHAFELLKEVKVKWGYRTQLGLIHETGGIPGILLDVASLDVELKQDFVRAFDVIAEKMESKAREKLGNATIDILERLCILTAVRTKNTAYKELQTICALFWGDVIALDVLQQVPALQSAGLIKQSGDYVAGLPPILARKLASNIMTNRAKQLKELFDNLDTDGRTRLLARIQDIRTRETGRCWNILFSPKGLFRDFSSALRNNYLLVPVARATPDRVLVLIEGGLKTAAITEREAIKLTPRRNLVRALGELMVHPTTSERAIRQMALLAEAETEKYANSATGIFCGCFHSLHPDIQASLQERLTILNDFLTSPQCSLKLRLIGIEAIRRAVDHSPPFVYYAKDEVSLTDPLPEKWMMDVLDYLDGLLALLRKMTDDKESTVVLQAFDFLPQALVEWTIQTLALRDPTNRLQTILGQFAALTDDVVLNKPMSPSALEKKLRVVENLVLRDIENRRNITYNDLKKTVTKSQRTVTLREIKRSIPNLIKFREEITNLTTKLHHADFPIRVKLFAGKNWSSEIIEDSHSEQSDSRAYTAARDLAEELLQRPELLTGQLLEYLSSEEAPSSYILLYELGRVDSRQQFVGLIERTEKMERGQQIFTHYFAGLFQDDPQSVDEYLDGLLGIEMPSHDTILKTTVTIGYTKTGFNRLKRMIRTRKINPTDVVREIDRGNWNKNLGSYDCFQLMKLVAGPDLKNATEIIRYLSHRSYNYPIKGKLAELAWQCLEEVPEISRSNNERQFDKIQFDQLASHLAAFNINRGFRLLRTILIRPQERTSEQFIDQSKRKYWNPFDQNNRKFWDVLWKTGSEHALTFVFGIARCNPQHSSRVTSDLLEVLDQEAAAESLIHIAFKNVYYADFVCQSVTPNKPRFWHIASQVIEHYPYSSKIHAAMSDAFMLNFNLGSDWVASHKRNTAELLVKIQRMRDDPDTTKSVQKWLSDLYSLLDQYARIRRFEASSL
jgi:hypothetical protein